MVAATDEISSWVKAYTADLYAYTLSKVENKLTAEDIVQNTFLSALESLHRFESKSVPKTWLFSILKNKIADYYRQKYKQVENFSVSDAADGLFDENGRLKAPCSSIQWSTDEELLDNPEFLLALHHCIEALPKKMSTVVELKYLDGTDSCRYFVFNSLYFTDHFVIQLYNDLVFIRKIIRKVSDAYFQFFTNTSYRYFSNAIFVEQLLGFF